MHGEGCERARAGPDGGTLSIESAHFPWCLTPVPLKTSRHCVPWREKVLETDNSLELFWK